MVKLHLSLDRYLLFTIQTGHIAEFCYQALLQLKASVTLSRTHHSYIQNYALKKICKTTQNKCLGYIQVCLDAGIIIMN